MLLGSPVLAPSAEPKRLTSLEQLSRALSNSSRFSLGAAYDAYTSLRGRTVHVRDLKEHLPEVYGRNGTHGPYLFLLLHGMGLAGQVQRGAHGALFTTFI